MSRHSEKCVTIISRLQYLVKDCPVSHECLIAYSANKTCSPVWWSRVCLEVWRQSLVWCFSWVKWWCHVLSSWWWWWRVYCVVLHGWEWEWRWSHSRDDHFPLQVCVWSMSQELRLQCRSTCQPSRPGWAAAIVLCCWLSLCTAEDDVDWLIEQGLTSPPTQYRLYGRRFFTGHKSQPTVSKYWRHT